MKTHLVGHISKHWGIAISACGRYHTDMPFTGYAGSRFGILMSKTQGVDCKSCLAEIDKLHGRKICCLDRTCTNRMWKGK